MNTDPFDTLLRDLVQPLPVAVRNDGETSADHQSTKAFAAFIEEEVLEAKPADQLRRSSATVSDTTERLLGASMAAASGNAFRFGRSLPPPTRARRVEPVVRV